MNRVQCKAACRQCLIILHQRWFRVKKVGVVPVRSKKSCIVQAVRQVVFTDVLIVGRLGVDGQSFAPFGLHKIDAASDWLLMKGLSGVSKKN